MAAGFCVAGFDLGLLFFVHALDLARVRQLDNRMVARQCGLAHIAAFLALARTGQQLATTLETHSPYGCGEFRYPLYLLCLRGDVHIHRHVLDFEFHHPAVWRIDRLGLAQTTPRSLTWLGLALGVCRRGALGLDHAWRHFIQSRWFGMGGPGVFGRHNLLWIKHPLLATLFKRGAHHDDCGRQPNRRFFGFADTGHLVLAQRLAQRQRLVEFADDWRRVHRTGLCALLPLDRQSGRFSDHDGDLPDSLVCQSYWGCFLR